MGAPAISTRPRTAARPKPKPKPKPRARAAAARPKARAAAAPARSPARSKPARRSRARHSSSSSGNVAMMPVNAVGRTAVVVGGIADSGVVVGMARSRVWIGVLGVLLGGIVAMNVVGLSLSAAGSQTSAKIDELIQDNSVQQSRLAHRLSNGQITKQATALGLAIPAPDAVRYLNSSASDAKQAAKRLADGSIVNSAPAVAPSEAATDPATVTTDPAAAADPTTVTTDPAAIDPAATATTDPAVAPVTTP